MAAQTLGTVPYEAGISVPVDGAIRFDAIGRIALDIVILAIFVFDCGRISQRIRRGGVAPKECRHKREAARNDEALHLHLQSSQFRSPMLKSYHTSIRGLGAHMGSSGR